MGVQASLSVLLLFITTVKAAEGGVTFSGVNFTMTCPEKGNWFNERKAISQGTANEVKLTYELQYSDLTKGSYYCVYTNKEETTQKYYFYVKGKVCPNCVELDATLFGLVIVVDLVMTTVLMMIIYKCTKKKSSAGLPHASKAPPRSGGRAPPVQSPHYEPLNTHTRSQDPYSVVHRMG